MLLPMINSRSVLVFATIICTVILFSSVGVAHHTYCEKDSNGVNCVDYSGDSSGLEGNLDRGDGYINWNHWVENSELTKSTLKNFTGDKDIISPFDASNLYDGTPYHNLVWNKNIDDYTINQGTSDEIKGKFPEPDNDDGIVRLDRITLRNSTLPKGSEATVMIAGNSGTFSSDKITEITFSGDQYDGVRTLGGENITKELQISDSDYKERYRIKLRLERDTTNIESPNIGSVSMYKNVPENRQLEPKYADYSEDVAKANAQMFENFDELADDPDSVYTPRLPQQEYTDRDNVNAGQNYIYKQQNVAGQKATPIRDVYTNISLIENSSVEFDDDPQEPVTISREGNLYVTFDGAKNDIPEGTRNNCGSDGADEGQDPCDDGQTRWSYNYENLTYNVSVTYVDSVSNTRTTIIEDRKSTSGGVEKISYDLNGVTRNTLGKFEVETEANLNIRKNTEEKVQDEEKCPDRNSTKPGYQVPRFIPIDGIPGASCDQGVTNRYDDGDGDSDFGFEEYRTVDKYVDSRVPDKVREYSVEVTDERTVRLPNREYKQSPASDGYNIDVVRFEDETRIRFERKSNGPGQQAQDPSFRGTRWISLEANGDGSSDTMVLNDGRRSSTEIELEKPIDNSNYPRMELFLRGEFADSNAFVSAYVKKAGDPGLGTKVYDRVSSSTDDRQSNVWHEVGVGNENEVCNTNCGFEDSIAGVLPDGTENVNVTIVTSSSVEDVYTQPRAWIYLYSDSEKSQGTVRSRWKYNSVRDTRWDTIYRLKDDCGDDTPACHDYQSKGLWLGDQNDDVNGGVGWVHPTPTIPLHTVLIPTNGSVSAPYQINEEGIELNNLSVRDRQNRAESRRQVMNENLYVDSDPTGVRQYCARDLEDGGERRCHLPKGMIRSDTLPQAQTTNEVAYNPNKAFIIESDKQIHNLRIEQDTAWSDSPLLADSVRRGSKVNIDIEKIDPISPQLRAQLNLPYNNEYRSRNSIGKNEVQLQLTLTDDNGDPISTRQRWKKANSLTRGDEYVYVNNTRNGLDPHRVGTDSNGVAYLVVEEDNDEVFQETLLTQLETEEEWWKLDEELTVLEPRELGSKGRLKSYDEAAGPAQGTSPKTKLLVIYALISSLFFVLSRTARTIPNADASPTDLAKRMDKLLPSWFWVLFVGGIASIVMNQPSSNITDMVWLVGFSGALTAAFGKTVILLSAIIFGFLTMTTLPVLFNSILLVIVALLAFNTN